MKNEFKWERIQAILPTGGEGTISSYYKNYAGRIYAKTGSLSNHLALSGYITTKKGRQLIFSVLVNAELAPAANIRKGVESF
jgi:D-alanyl-D-alanine carboxypeptidase/D-alanyl-D-alanine-endopeptidase (penicillin-binding protein 4)